MRNIANISRSRITIGLVGLTLLGCLFASPRVAAAAIHPATTGCAFYSLPGHSDTRSHTYNDGDTVTVHSQLYEYEYTATRACCGQLEAITSITDNSAAKPPYGTGGNKIVYRQSNSRYSMIGQLVDGYPGQFTTLQPIAVTTTCAAPGGSFTPSDGEATIQTGAANYCV